MQNNAKKHEQYDKEWEKEVIFYYIDIQVDQYKFFKMYFEGGKFMC